MMKFTKFQRVSADPENKQTKKNPARTSFILENLGRFNGCRLLYLYKYSHPHFPFSFFFYTSIVDQSLQVTQPHLLLHYLLLVNFS